MRQIRDLPIDIAWELARHEAWISRRGGRSANLSYSNLSYSNLSDSDLNDSNLRDSDLRGCVGGGVVRLDMGGWSVCVRATETSIGCEQHPNADWLRWTPDDVAHMAEGAREWWQAHGDLIRAAIRDVQARA